MVFGGAFVNAYGRSADAHMSDDALGKDQDRRQNITPAPPYGTHRMPDGSVMPNPRTSGRGGAAQSVGELAAKAFLIQRLVKLYPAYYTTRSLANKPIQELTDLLDFTPQGPPGPPPPPVSFATYE